MTNEEAIKILEVTKAEVEWNYPMDYQIALDKAIEALRRTEADGCEGCQHTDKAEDEMPCKICSRDCMDCWTPKKKPRAIGCYNCTKHGTDECAWRESKGTSTSACENWRG